MSEEQKLKLKAAMARRNSNPANRAGQKATRLLTEQARIDLHTRLHDFLAQLEGRLDGSSVMLEQVCELQRLLELSKLGRSARLRERRCTLSFEEMMAKELGFTDGN